MADTAGRAHAVLQNLIDAGCDTDLAKRYFELQYQGKGREQLGLLTAHRRSLLNEIHAAQKCLDCLDHLLYQMQKENTK